MSAAVTNFRAAAMPPASPRGPLFDVEDDILATADLLAVLVLIFERGKCSLTDEEWGGIERTIRTAHERAEAVRRAWNEHYRESGV